jgi:Leucine-rich repeat (LRR) protein
MEPTNLSSLDDDYAGSHESSVNFMALFPELRCLEVLALRWQGGYGDAGPPTRVLASILHSLPLTLERLALRPIDKSNMHHAKSAHVALPNLTSLSLPNVPIHRLPDSLVNSPSLTEIQCSLADGHAQGLPQQRFSVPSNLTALDFTKGPLKRNMFVLPSTVLKLACDSTDSDSIAKMPRNLKFLKIGATLSIMNQQELQHFPPTLETLEITIPTRTLTHFEWVPHTVTSLKVSGSSLDDVQVPPLATLPPKLRTFHLGITARWHESHAAKLPKTLVDLALETACGLSAQFYKNLPKTLRCLYLGGDPGKAIGEVLRENDGSGLPPNLTSLRLPGLRYFSADILPCLPKRLNDFHVGRISVSNEFIANQNLVALDTANWAVLLKPFFPPAMKLSLNSGTKYMSSQRQDELLRSRAMLTYPQPFSKAIVVDFQTDAVSLPNSLQKLRWGSQSDTAFRSAIASVPNLTDLECHILVNFDIRLQTQTLTRISAEQINVLRYDDFPNLRILQIPRKILRQKQATLPPSLTHLCVQQVDPGVIRQCTALEKLELTSAIGTNPELLAALPGSLTYLRGYEKDYSSTTLTINPWQLKLPQKLTFLSLHNLYVDTQGLEKWLPTSIRVFKAAQITISNTKEVLEALQEVTLFDNVPSASEMFGQAYLKLLRPSLETIEWGGPATYTPTPPVTIIRNFIELLPRALQVLLMPPQFVSTEPKIQIQQLKTLPSNLVFLDIAHVLLVHHATQFLPRSLKSLVVNGSHFNVLSVAQLPRSLTFLQMTTGKWKKAMSEALPSTLRTFHLYATAGSPGSIAGMPHSITCLHLDVPCLTAASLPLLPPSVTNLYMIGTFTESDAENFLPHTVKFGEIRRVSWSESRFLHLGLMLRPPQP